MRFEKCLLSIWFSDQSSNEEEDKKQQIYEKIVSPFLEKLDTKSSSIISSELKDKIVKAILETDPDSFAKNFDSDDGT